MNGVYIVNGYCLITERREVMAVFSTQIEAEKYKNAVENNISSKDWNSIEIECWAVNESFNKN